MRRGVVVRIEGRLRDKRRTVVRWRGKSVERSVVRVVCTRLPLRSRVWSRVFRLRSAPRVVLGLRRRIRLRPLWSTDWGCRRILVVLRRGRVLPGPRSHGRSVGIRFVVWRDDINVFRWVSSRRSRIMYLWAVVLNWHRIIVIEGSRLCVWDLVWRWTMWVGM